MPNRSPDERLGLVERGLESHSETITILVNRVGELEKSERERRIREAVAEERSVSRGEQLERIEHSIDDIKREVREGFVALKKDYESKFEKINSAGMKVFWILVAGLLAAIGNFIYRGGLMP